ncbi:MAG: hypothetical protein HGN29_16610 [Asgard group archaeon]|nr:hypothetical protein [Asgard group archaeon]
MKNETSDKIHLKIELSEEDFQMFSEIQTHYNIKNKTDVLRLCIKDAFRIMKRREQLLKEMV